MIIVDFLLGCFMLFMSGMNCAKFVYSERKDKMALGWCVGMVLLGLYFLIGVIGMMVP